MKAKAPFTSVQRTVIEALRRDLTKRIQCKVTVDFGSTDDGRIHDAALCVESLPAEAEGISGPLVSILTGPGIAGDGFAVMAADGASLIDGVNIAEAVNYARFAGVREFRGMRESVLAA